MKKCIEVSLLLVAGNIFYQWALYDIPNWAVAAERSWFQICACVTYFIMMKLDVQRAQNENL